MPSSYYVDPVGGEDRNDGLAPERPVRTIARASELAGAGDTVRLHAGRVFTGTTRFPPGLAGSPEQPIIVEPYAGSTVVLDGRATDPAVDTVPNEHWERVPGGHPEEWRTRRVLDENLPEFSLGRIRYGSFADTRLRLITYSRIEDLRADNESFHAVPLSDPRLAGGPLRDRPDRKMPWTYFGPGLIWVAENSADPAERRGRVHVRLSHTHLRAPGTTDYAGPVDPNRVPLALAAENRVAVFVGATNVVLRNLVIAGGGTTTLNVTEHARGVVFDHCAVYGGRFGVRVSGQAQGIRFAHCTFDGALAPWTVRADVKSEYVFLDPQGVEVTGGAGKETHDILVISHAANAVEFDSCTFRRAHDALQIGGADVSVHHCLFEDLNDEVVQFNTTQGARIFKNLIRQALNPFSFALERTGGPIYIYRNVIDQRVPTRGYRTLPPDAPAPHIWRYGASFKSGQPMPDVFVYHNTFIGSHHDDKAHALSPLFARGDLSPDAPRVHLNNLIVGLNLDLPYSWAMATSPARRSDGNLWWTPHRVDAPLFRFQLPDGSSEAVATVEELRALDPLWEADSRFGDPGLVNVDDEYFEHGRYLGTPYPNNDFRPAPGSPAIGAGVVLPADLPDPDRAGAARPDIGALAAGAPPLRVGVNGEVVLPVPGMPVADAGPDQTMVDTERDGFASVTVDGSASVGAATYVWSEAGVVLANTAVATVNLDEGDHYLRLSVTNGNGAADTDAVHVRIRPPEAHGPNLVRCPGFEDQPCAWELTGASIVSTPAHSGRRALRLDSPSSVARQRVPVSPDARYRVSAWVAGTLPAAALRVRLAFLDAGGAPVRSTDHSFTTGSGYAYREVAVVAPPDAVAVDLSLIGAAGHQIFVDDVRILDANLLTNGGFETPAPTGNEEDAPGWRFEAGGARVSTDPANVRGGGRAVELIGLLDDYRQVVQDISGLPGASRYRVSAWLKTVGVDTPPTLFARFDNGSRQAVVRATSDGAYAYFSGELAAPSGASRLTISLRLEMGTTGTAYFDDLLVEPLN